ncbi:unnamed protein product [Macrosiphum euphorbiae]|uniref:Uncharacterized protein n=1 Tax=Macrosiphum euphorbiae TaxID=13131 RepID=A0AAV0XBL2_9HEMI|nr:unnamed protein product [Macrosiphum euphorbiae]
MAMTKKQKKFLKLLLLHEAEEEEAIIQYILTNEKNKVHQMFLSRKTEGFFNIIIEKHLWRDGKKCREFFQLNWDQFNYVLNLIEEDIKTSPSIKVPEPITAAEKLAVTLSETEPSQNMIGLARAGGYANFEGFLVRDEFKKFFNFEEGAVPWQDHQTQKTDNAQ